MNKVLSILAILLAALALFAAFVWYFATALDPAIPGSADVDNLEAELEIEWYPLGAAISVNSSNDLDAYRAIGFVHATQHAWHMALLRQTAIGKLGKWFNHDVSEIDSLTSVLGIGSTARAAYSDLDNSTASILKAYADGVNAALHENRSYRDQSFLAVDRVPDPWEPWHSIAIEKLLAWISAAGAIDESGEFSHLPLLQSTNALMRWIEVGGLNNSMAWTVHHRDSTVVGVRYITGGGKTPVLVPVSFDSPASQQTMRVSILGTPFSLFSQTADHGIAILPTSSARIRTFPASRADLVETFDRLVNFEGEETLLARVKLGDDLVQDCVPAVSASTEQQTELDPNILRCMVLDWPGLDNITDAARWKDQYDARFFRLWTGTALAFDKSGSAEMTDSPGIFPAAFGNRVRATGSSRWTPFWRSRLVQLTSSRDWRPTNIPHDVKSTWAERWTLQLIQNVDTSSTESPLIKPALSYLRNWDFSYSGSSIAGSVLDAWALEAIADSVDLYNIQVDSVSGATAQLVRALSGLEARFGSDLSDWRWESVNRHALRTPAWSFIGSDSTRSSSYRQIVNRLDPPEVSAGGHPSTLAWNPSNLSGTVPFPGALYVTTVSTHWNDILLYPNLTGHLSEMSPANTVNGAVRFTEQDVIARTTLRPASD